MIFYIIMNQAQQIMRVGSGKGIVIFDGVCNICNFGVRFVHRFNGKKENIHFTWLQSFHGEQILRQVGLTPADCDKRFVFIYEDQHFTASTAAVQIARHLDFPMNLLYIFKIVPTFMRDPLYDFVAKNRYTFFGKTEVCQLPSESLKKRMI